jgi:PAS domain S-box-containing protein
MLTLTDSSQSMAVVVVAVVSVAAFISVLGLNVRVRRQARDVRARGDQLCAVMMQMYHEVVRCKDREAVFASVCRVAVGEGGFRAAWVKVESTENGAHEIVAWAGVAEAPSKDLSEALADRRGAMATFPLRQNGRVIGAWILDSGEESFFKDAEVRLFTKLAEEISFALDTCEREVRRESSERALDESQTWLKLAIEAAGVGLVDLNLPTGEIYLSPDWKSQLGYADGDWTEDVMEWHKLIHPEDSVRLAERLRCCLAGSTVKYDAEFRLKHRDGSYRWISTRAQLVRDAQSEPVRIVGWLMDTTVRRLAEEALRESEARLQTVIENLDEALIIANLDGQLLHWNRSALAMLDFRESDNWLKRLPDMASIFELSAADGRVLPLEEWPLARIIRGEAVRDLELTLRRLDMEWRRTFSFGGARGNAGDKHPIAFLTMVDITERAKGALAITESEARFRELAEHVDEVFWIIDPVNRKMLYVSPAYEKIWGRRYHAEPHNNPTWPHAVHAEDRARVNLAVAVRQEKGTYEEIYRIFRPDGTQRWIRDRAFPVRNAAGHVYRIVGTAQDITDWKRGDIRQKLQHKITSMFAESRPLPETTAKVVEHCCRAMGWLVGEFWMLDPTEGELRLVASWHAEAPECAAFTQHSREMTFKVGQGLPGRICKLNEPIWTDALDDKNDFMREHEARLAGLHTAYGFPVRLRDEAVGGLLFFGAAIPPPDETLRALSANLASQLGQYVQRLRVEEQFLHSQKMEAIGQLAGGVAHDFNNLLTVMMAYPQLILFTPNLTVEVRDWLQQMMIAADRAAGLTRQLLAFSRKQVLSFQPADLNEVVNGMEEMLRRIIGENIELWFERAPALGLIEADRGMLEQTLMNLVVNARDAMPRGGRLTVTTARVKIEGSHLQGRAKARPGDFVTLVVADTGCGMPPEVMRRIFEPFFTTKEPGLGTGLGLATIYGIAEQHRGWVEAESVKGAGSRFTVFFPLSRIDEAAPVEKTEGAGMIPGRETILLVEDEPAVRLLLKVVLARLGYRVFEAASGVVALEVWAQHRDEIDLLVTDMVMPHGVTGRDLAEKLRVQNPSLKILFMTGYSPASVAGGMKLFEGVNFIQKPYAPQVLAKAIRACLERPPVPIS